MPGETIGSHGLVNNEIHTQAIQVLHDALDGTCTEVIRTLLHDQPVDSSQFRLARGDLLRYEPLARIVGFNHGLDQGLRHILVVGQQLLGVLGQAIPAIAE